MGYLGNQITTTFPSSISVDDATISGNTTIGGATTVSGAFTSQGIDDNADATAITIDSSENVGIGTTSPSGKLNLATGAGTPCELRLTSNNTGSGAGDRGRIVVYSARNDGTAYEAGKIEIDRSSGTQDKGHILFYTNGGSGVTERARIADGGAVNLGTNGSYSGFIVNSTIGGADTYRATTAGGIHHFSSDVGGTSTLKSYINENGSLISASDYRLKENVVDLPSSLETIKTLRPVNFNFINETKLQSGFIAHELKEQISHIVDGDKDQVKEDGSMFIQMVDYSSLIPHLTKALQEATAKIEALEARVTELEGV